MYKFSLSLFLKSTLLSQVNQPNGTRGKIRILKRQENANLLHLHQDPVTKKQKNHGTRNLPNQRMIPSLFTFQNPSLSILIQVQLLLPLPLHLGLLCANKVRLVSLCLFTSILLPKFTDVSDVLPYSRLWMRKKNTIRCTRRSLNAICAPRVSSPRLDMSSIG